ncbi:sulfotransferase [Mesorhizobium sp.]|uniref:tetratricopeptide repeat-containing sulfotransferase family protein n=1 Tax=Mesorhizobium sp. TaxID=1871066 RepID=UPI0026AF3CDA
MLRQALELKQANRLAEAEQLCRRVLARTAEHPLALYTMGVLGLEIDTELAITYFERATKQAPQNARFRLALGEAFFKVGELPSAIEHLRHACELQPDLLDALCALGRAYVMSEQATQALPIFERVLKLSPNHPRVRLDLANALTSVGQMEEAGKHLKDAIARRLNMPAAINELVHAKEFKEEPPELAVILKELANPQLTPSAAQQLHQAAGKVMDDIHRYEQAMDHFQKGKSIAGQTFDLESYRKGTDFLIDLFSPEMFAAKSGHGNPSELPVFVLGMPRSGTTLTEQICASHPSVHGAGELTELRRVGDSIGLRREPAHVLKQSIMSMTSDQLSAVGDKYLSSVRRSARGSLRVIDKMPHNFELIGLIALLFPNARIIHCRRDAIDNCLSCYMSNFNSDHSYNADLRTLGYFYREYDRLMRHWQKVLPGRIFVSSYETLIADQEQQSRRLIEHLGLPWDDACLRFFDRAGSVNTPSRWQVRQPLYASSVKRWKNYGDRIQPLIDALGELAEV